MSKTPVHRLPYKKGQRSVYVFHLQGGDPISVKTEGSPMQTHNGKMSVWRLFLTNEQSQSLVHILNTRNIRVLYVDGKIDRGGEQREKQVQWANREWRTPKCPTCYWTDPNLPTECKLDYQELIPNPIPEKAQKDAEECPLLEIEIHD